jgi:hypothetical protein
MKNKALILAALVGTAAVSANAGVNFGITIGVPMPVVVTAPVAPAPCVETIPACPGRDYVWAPGYWSLRETHYVWVRGGWNHRPVHGYRDHRW